MEGREITLRFVPHCPDIADDGPKVTRFSRDFLTERESFSNLIDTKNEYWR